MHGTVNNVVVFVSDALRYDHLPASLVDDGLALKTVAASIDTSTAIPSMVTGLRPPGHGVFSFEHRLPAGTPTVFDLEGYDTGFYNAAGPDDGLNSVLRREELTRLEELEPPFCYVERDHGGHHPYHGVGYEGGLEAFRKEFAGDVARTRRTYAEAIEASVERFRDRIRTIEERGLLEETLLVFTSDHGELLGENGLVGHLTPVHPEVVYVPTLFVGPDLPEASAVDQSFMGHVDLLPTLLGALGEPAPGPLDGVDVLDPGTPRIDRRYNFAAKSVYVGDRPFWLYRASSLWDDAGGHVFNRSSWPGRLASAGYLLAGRKWMSRHVRRLPWEFPAAARGYLESERTFGSPGFSAATARETVERIETERTDAESVDLDDAVKRRLEQLGYR
jgi:arylsulfatase A-like enzyme